MIMALLPSDRFVNLKEMQFTLMGLLLFRILSLWMNFSWVVRIGNLVHWMHFSILREHFFINYSWLFELLIASDEEEHKL